MRAQNKLKNKTDTIRPETEIRKIHPSLLQKKVVLWIKKLNKSGKKLHLQIKFECKTGPCSEASSSEEEDIGMRKGRRKRYFDNTNKELNGSSIEEEEIKYPKCGRKGDVETKNEETKGSNSEEEEIGKHRFRRKGRIDKITEKLKGWTSSSKQQ